MGKNYTLNNKRIECWKTDARNSVLFYNSWFMDFAPSAYKKARSEAVKDVESAFAETDCLSRISIESTLQNPKWISILRMATTPPLARDRLAGLADVNRNVLKTMDSGLLPKRVNAHDIEETMGRVVEVVMRLLDKDIMPWIEYGTRPDETDKAIAAKVIADRLCGALADPIMRNEQECRQLNSIKSFLESYGYEFIGHENISVFTEMPPATFTYHLNLKAIVGTHGKVNIPVDVVVMRRDAKRWKLPLLIECKSAGDSVNTNKRRKEEAVKVAQLRQTYGTDIEFVLFLCGYFDTGYLGYEAAEGIDWVWEHRIEDLLKAGI